MRKRWWAMPVLAGGAAALAACGGSAAPSSGGSGTAGTTPAANQASGATGSGTVMVSEHSTKVGAVLTNANGHTLYWFAIDTPTKSNCTGTCATYWPPVIGKAAAASGMSLPGKFGTIKRPGGKLQATYDGHPLYTYAADTSAGQVGGNGLNVSGGLWWAMTPSGAKPSASGGSSSPSSSSGGGY